MPRTSELVTLDGSDSDDFVLMVRKSGDAYTTSKISTANLAPLLTQLGLTGVGVVTTAPSGELDAERVLTAASGLKIDLSVAGSAIVGAMRGEVNGLAPLDADGKVPESYLPSSVTGAIEYKGTWNPASGYPSNPDKGDYYVVSVAGDCGGISYAVSDWSVYNGISWQKIDRTPTAAETLATTSAFDGLLNGVSGNLQSIVDALDDHNHDNRYYTENEIGTSGSSTVSIGNVKGNPSGATTGSILFAAGSGAAISGDTLLKYIDNLLYAPAINISGAVTLAAMTTAGILKNNAAGVLSGGNKITVSDINASGTPSSSTFYRGDGQWAAPPVTTPAGGTGYIQFNSSGAFAGDANLTYDPGTDTLGVANATFTGENVILSGVGSVAPQSDMFLGLTSEKKIVYGRPPGGKVSGIAGETLSARDLVYYANSDGKWYKIDIDATPPQVGYPRGIADGAANINASVTVTVIGEVSGFSGLTIGAKVFADTVAGGYTQTKPTVTDGGAEKVIIEIGVALSETTILVMPTSPMRFLRRASLAENGTLTVTHPTDNQDQTRHATAFITTTVEGSTLTTYASSNQDSDVSINKPTSNDTTVTINATGSSKTIGNGGSSNVKRAQGFQCTATGVLSQFTFTLCGVSGSPGSISWEMRADNGGSPTGSLLASGTIANPLTNGSNDVVNTVTVADGPTLTSGSYYWLVLFLTNTPGTNVYYSWRASSTSVYPNGSEAYYTTSWTNESAIDLNCTITTSVLAAAKTRLAQSFQIASGSTVGTAKLWLRKTGSPAGNLTLYIKSDVSGAPGTTIANGTSNMVNVSTLGTSYGWITFEFAQPPSLSAGTTYWLELQSSSDESSSNYTSWGADGSASGYANGEMKSYASFYAAEGKDAVFEINSPAGVSYDQPIQVGSWSLSEGKVAVRYDDGVGAESATKTTFKNLHTATLDLTCIVELP